jgi:hypothetical protein
MKLCTFKVVKVLVVRISGLPLSGQKIIWMWPPWRGVEYTIRGKVVASPSPGHGESCVSELLVPRPSTKSAPTRH